MHTRIIGRPTVGHTVREHQKAPLTSSGDLIRWLCSRRLWKGKQNLFSIFILRCWNINLTRNRLCITLLQSPVNSAVLSIFKQPGQQRLLIYGGGLVFTLSRVHFFQTLQSDDVAKVLHKCYSMLLLLGIYSLRGINSIVYILRMQNDFKDPHF